MKKIIFALSLLFALTTVTFAQEKNASTVSETSTESEKKIAPEVFAKKEVATLAEFAGLNDQQVNELYKILIQKYQVLSEVGFSAERKAAVIKNFEAKVKKILTEEQNKKFEPRKEEFQKIMNALTESK